LDQRIFSIPRLRDGDLAILDHKPCQPEPNWVVPACTNSSLTFSIDPKDSMSAFSRLLELATAIRLDDFQYSEWL